MTDDKTAPAVHRLLETFAVMQPDQGVTPIDVTPALYQQLDTQFDAFKGHWLLSVHEFKERWSTWECHPAGDEIVILLSGACRFTLKTPTGESDVRLAEAGEYVVVPKGYWHIATPESPTRMLFITPGEGTLNAEKPDD